MYPFAIVTDSNLYTDPKFPTELVVHLKPVFCVVFDLMNGRKLVAKP